MYGVAVVIDILTGYVTDYEVLSKYCHACAISKSKDIADDQRQAWNAGHALKCIKYAKLIFLQNQAKFELKRMNTFPPS